MIQPREALTPLLPHWRPREALTPLLPHWRPREALTPLFLIGAAGVTRRVRLRAAQHLALDVGVQLIAPGGLGLLRRPGRVTDSPGSCGNR